MIGRFDAICGSISILIVQLEESHHRHCRQHLLHGFVVFLSQCRSRLVQRHHPLRQFVGLRTGHEILGIVLNDGQLVVAQLFLFPGVVFMDRPELCLFRTDPLWSLSHESYY
jgi:hypothetical protein